MTKRYTRGNQRSLKAKDRQYNDPQDTKGVFRIEDTKGVIRIQDTKGVIREVVKQRTDNTMTQKIQKGYSEVVNQRTDNTMTKK